MEAPVAADAAAIRARVVLDIGALAGDEMEGEVEGVVGYARC